MDEALAARKEGATPNAQPDDAFAAGIPLDHECLRGQCSVIQVGPGREHGEGIEQRMNACAGHGGAEHHRHDLARTRSVGERGLDDMGIHHAIVGEPVFEQGIVKVGERRNRGLVVQEMPHAHVGITRAEMGCRRQWQGCPAKPGFQLGHQRFLTGAHAIDLVAEDDTRQVERADRAGEAAGLRLHAFDAGNDEDHGIKHRQGAFDFGDEIRMAGRIDQVHLQVVPGERGHGGADGNATLLFQRQGIGLGGAGIDTAEGSDGTGFEQETFGQAGLAGINMGKHPEIEHSRHEALHFRQQRGWTWGMLLSCACELSSITWCLCLPRLS